MAQHRESRHQQYQPQSQQRMQGEPGQQLGGGQQFGGGGQQFGQGGQTGQRIGEVVSQQPGDQKFEDHLTSELKRCLEDCQEVERVAEWCADKCLDHGPQMANCVRLCEETADLADVTAKFIARDAFTAPHVAETFAEVAEQALQELDRHQAPHTFETAFVVDRAIDSTYEALDTIGQQGQMGQQSQMGQQGPMDQQGQMGQRGQIGQQGGQFGSGMRQSGTGSRMQSQY